VPLLGLPAESTWALLAPFSDKTLLRDLLVYGWSLSIGRYAPRGRFVEVFVKSAPGKLTLQHYQGVYELVEDIKLGANRLDLKRLDRFQNSPPEVTGGYLLKKHRLDAGEVGLRTSRGHVFQLIEPGEERLTPAQRQWITTYLNDLERALYGQSFADPIAGYASWLETETFIDHHLLVELTKNIDGYRLNTYYHKDRGGKLKIGPLWNFELALGNANYLEGWKPEGWYHQQLSDGDYPWWRRLFQDAEFARRYAERWIALRQGPLRLARLIGDVDDHAALLAEAAGRNFQRWPILGTYVWPNWFVGRTWEEELDFLRSWLRDRVAWMDAQFVPPPAFGREGGAVPAGFRLAMSAPSGEIFFTLDDSDPRSRDGAIAAAAMRFTEPVALTRDSLVKARARVGAEVWSALKVASFQVTPLPDGGLQLPGDLNQDRRANITDAVSLLRRLVAGGASALPCEGQALDQGANRLVFDLNADAAVNLSDAVYLLNYLFRGGPPPSLGTRCVPVRGCPETCGPP
jgi:hypothetical protein